MLRAKVLKEGGSGCFVFHRARGGNPAVHTFWESALSLSCASSPRLSHVVSQDSNQESKSKSYRAPGEGGEGGGGVLQNGHRMMPARF